MGVITRVPVWERSQDIGPSVCGQTPALRITDRYAGAQACYIAASPIRKSEMPRPMEKAQIERWVTTWREAAPALEQQRRAEIEQLSTPVALAQLASAFALARLRAPHSDTSGLVEQQRYFQQLLR